MGLFKKKKQEKLLTRAECLARLRECMEKANFSHELTDEERGQMEYSLQIITCFVRLNDCEEITETRAIGFEIESEEEDEEDDEEEDDEE